MGMDVEDDAEGVVATADGGIIVDDDDAVNNIGTLTVGRRPRHNKLINRRKRKRKSAHSPDTTGTSGPADLEETEFDMTPR